MEDIGHIPVCVRVQYPTINCSFNFPFLIDIHIYKCKEHSNMQISLSCPQKHGLMLCVSSKERVLSMSSLLPEACVAMEIVM